MRCQCAATVVSILSEAVWHPCLARNYKILCKMIDSQEDYKQIDDIIDVRKKLGQYNVHKQSPINYRYAYSNAATTSDKFVRFDDTTMTANEGDFLNNNSDLKLTDSEITVVRVRCDGLTFKRKASKWDMHDIAIPGDGSHLGESPSLVNLATLVQQNDEYLVPLSSWDPYYNNNTNNEDQSDNRTNLYLIENLQITENSTDGSNETTSQMSEDNSNSAACRRSSFAGRISKFLRARLRKSKTLPESTVYQPSDNEKSPKV